MPNNSQWLQMFERWLDTIGLCGTLPMSAPACHPFWQAVMYASAAIGIVLAGGFIWKLVDFRMKHAAALRAQRERERVAGEAEMRAHTRVEPADIAADVTDPHLAKKIRRELERQRRENRRL